MSEAQHHDSLAGAWRMAVPIVAAVLPLVTWPGLAEAFSTPKRWLLAGAVAVLLPLAAWQTARGRHGARRVSDAVPPLLQATLVIWLASFAWSALAAPSVSPDALVLGIAGPLWCFVIVLAAVPATRVADAHVAGTTAMASVGIAQAAGLDPFVWFGWVPGIAGASHRMRVYGTLGNPDFVAALIAATIPLACGLAVAPGASRPRRTVIVLAIGVLASALFVTGSRAGAFGLACGVVVFAAILRHRLSRWVMAGAVLASVGAMAVSDGRGAVETLRGRAYVWHTTWAHAWEHPVTGLGPGAFELHYAGWDRAVQAALGPGHRDARFAGPQQFAHQDYFQALVERGVAGLVATLVVLATPVLVWRRSRRVGVSARAALAGAAGAVAACAAVACFDFPLQRPAEAAALWMSVALAWQAARSASLTPLNRDTQGEMTR
ncbi:MAG: O-antigen ligase family protein [Acidobacteria bacterium]|nr:O-antigen ligase family protein [Acidobacteriota bacterium]